MNNGLAIFYLALAIFALTGVLVTLPTLIHGVKKTRSKRRNN